MLEKPLTVPRFYNHPLIRENRIEFRDYQVNIFNTAKQKNTLIVLPTALGKTMIALFAAVDVLQYAPQSKIFILAPTRPLVVQHYQNFQKFLVPQIKCCMFTANLSPIQRTLALNDSQIFFSTPQIVQNDLKWNRYNLCGVGLIIFDESHKARKNYAYGFDAQTYIQQCTRPLIMALTASPGKDIEYINNLCQKLFIEQIIFRDHESPDVMQYTFPIEINFTRIELPTPLVEAQAILESALRKVQDFLIDKRAFLPKNYFSKMDYIRLIQDLKIVQSLSEYDIQNNPELLNSLTFPHLIEFAESQNPLSDTDHTAVLFQAINGIYLSHLVEILTTQDVRMFRNYLNKLSVRAADGNKHLQRLLSSQFIQKTKELLQEITQSPKIPALLTILQNELFLNPNGKYIIFTQYREMANYLLQEFSRPDILPSPLRIKAIRFVGQASRPEDPGLTQQEQQTIIKAFENKEYNILIATSVAEEGLDIPSVDAVIFYEAVPSEIRLIQRRGRTGRHEIGRCYFLVSPETLDQTYHIVSHRKEEKMQDILKHPEMITTVEPIVRLNEMPAHKVRSIVEIKNQIEEEKKFTEQRKLEQVQEAIQNHHSSTIKRNAKFALVTDITTKTPDLAKQRVKVQSEFEIIQEERKKRMRGLVKKHLEWICSTMENVGTWVNYQEKNCLGCKRDLILSAAKEENQNIAKIRMTLTQGINKGIFAQKSDMIFLIDQ